VTPAPAEKSVSEEKAAGLLREADELLAKKQPAQARAVFKELLRLSGLLPWAAPLALTNIADTYRREGDLHAAQETYRKLLARPDLSEHFRLYTLLNRAETAQLEQAYDTARGVYRKILPLADLAFHHRMRARLGLGDTYRAEAKYTGARSAYREAFAAAQAPPFPHEHFRTLALERLERVKDLADGQPLPDPRKERVAWTEKPRKALHVATTGNDAGPGTDEAGAPQGLLKAQRAVGETQAGEPRKAGNGHGAGASQDVGR